MADLGELSHEIRLEIKGGILHIHFPQTQIDIKALLHTQDRILLTQIQKTIDNTRLSCEEKLIKISKYLQHVY